MECQLVYYSQQEASAIAQFLTLEHCTCFSSCSQFVCTTLELETFDELPDSVGLAEEGQILPRTTEFPQYQDFLLVLF